MAIVITEQTFSSVKKIDFAWTLVDGVVSGATTKTYDGEVLRVNAMACACTGYALLIEDSDGVDLLAGRGAALTSGGKDFGTSTGSVSMPISVVSGALTLDITASTGKTDTGETIVYVR